MRELIEAHAEVRLLDFRARVSGPSPVLRKLATIFPDAPGWSNQIDRPFSVSVRAVAAATDASRGQIYCDDVLQGESDDSADLLAGMIWAITTRAIEDLGDRHLLFHAGAAAWENRGVLFPAAGGSGKTTLVATLLTRGFQYFGDDVAVVSPAETECLPFAQSLSIKAGAWELLTPLYSELADSWPVVDFRGQIVAYLQPPAGAWPKQPASIGFVIVPTYTPNAVTTLTPIARVQALRALLEQSFNARRLGGQAILKASEVVRQAECYALTFSDARLACDLVQQVVS